jgi:dephospho-CoA kinase
LTIASQQEQSGKAAQIERQEKLVACITGMPGAGKSTVADAAQEVGFEIFRMGDDVRMEAEKRGVAPSDENLGAIMMELRQRGGLGAIAALSKKRIEKESTSRFVAIDGIRNMNEVLEFKKIGKAVLIAVHASPPNRYKYLQSRKRSDSPASYQSFEARDRREMSVGVAESIAMADEVIVNSSSVEDLRNSAKSLFQKLKESDPSS